LGTLISSIVSLTVSNVVAAILLLQDARPRGMALNPRHTRGLAASISERVVDDSPKVPIRKKFPRLSMMPLIVNHSADPIDNSLII
jgi:hypothetical protein